MNNGLYYNPVPPRAWSRVQDPCSLTTVPFNQYLVYVPLTKKTVPPGIADYQNKMLYKGNILQYKKNSSNLTQRQRYSQISKGLWTNRTKNYATQSQTYTNPNTTSLLRVNYTTIPYPNFIVGSPNNESGPYQYNVPNPFGCSSTSVQDGGNLICNTTVNPCTNDIIKKTYVQNCFPTSCSDVPGKIQDLCWDPKVNTWYPRQRYFMNNSNNKWPQNYKEFVSAVRPAPPVLSLDSSSQSTSVNLSWTYKSNNCLAISSFNIYQNGKLVQSVSYTVTNITINGTSNSSFFVTSLSTKIESTPSNKIRI